MKSRISIIAILCLLGYSAAAQFFLLPNEYHYRITNNLSIVVDDQPQMRQVQANLVFKIGPYMEDTTLDGHNFLYFHLLQQQLNKGLAQIPRATLQAHIELEHTNFDFTLPNEASFPMLLDLIYHTFQEPSWDSTNLEQAKNDAFAAIEAAKKQPERHAINQLRLQLWGNYQSHMTIYENIENIANADSVSMAALHEQFYCPGYALLTVRGAVDNRDIRFKSQVKFNGWMGCRYSPLNRKVVPEYQTLAFSRQNVMLAPVDEAEFLILFQGPALIISDKDALSAALLADMLQNADSLRARLDSTAIKSLRLDFDLQKYAADLRFFVVPKKDELIEGYHDFFSLMDSIAYANVFSAEEFESAKKRLANELTAKSKDANRTKLMEYYWTIGRSEWIKTLETDIAALAMDDVKAATRQYVCNNTYTSALLAEDTTGITSAIQQEYTSTKTDVFDYTFNFAKNTADIISDDADSLMNSLFQFLKINPQAKMRVIGAAGKDELSKVTDPQMGAFVDSLRETTTIGQQLKAHGSTFRLDVYRSLVTIKYLLDRGIPPGQIEVTSLMLKPKEFTNEMERRKVFFHIIY